MEIKCYKSPEWIRLDSIFQYVVELLKCFEKPGQ